MEVELRAGAKFDLASTDELRDTESRIMAAVHDGALPLTIKHTAQATTDAGGLLGGGRTGGGALLYPCPDGMYASFKRISIAAPGATPGTPIAGGAWMTLNTDSGGDLQQEAIIPQTGQTQALPCLITDGSAAIVLRRGSKLVVVGAALPVSTTISFRFQIELYHTAKAAEAATAQGG